LQELEKVQQQLSALAQAQQQQQQVSPAPQAGRCSPEAASVDCREVSAMLRVCCCFCSAAEHRQHTHH
jgi:hypothetical protein